MLLKFMNSIFSTLYIHVFCVTGTIYSQRFLPPTGICDRGAVVFSVAWRLLVPARLHSSEKLSLSLSCSPVSICPRDSTRLSVHGFPSNLILETYVRAYLEYPNLVKIRKKWRVLYMKSDVHFFFCQRIKIRHKALLCNSQYFYVVDS